MRGGQSCVHARSIYPKAGGDGMAVWMRRFKKGVGVAEGEGKATWRRRARRRPRSGAGVQVGTCRCCVYGRSLVASIAWQGVWYCSGTCQAGAAYLYKPTPAIGERWRGAHFLHERQTTHFLVNASSFVQVAARIAHHTRTHMRETREPGAVCASRRDRMPYFMRQYASGIMMLKVCEWHHDAEIFHSDLPERSGSGPRSWLHVMRIE